MKVVIVGGGLSGLTLAERLSKEHEIILIEKECSLGGLARSIRYKNAVFDIGPHLFTAHEKKVDDYFLSFFKENPERLIEGIKRTKLNIKGGFVSWPPTFLELLRLDMLGVIAAGINAFKGAFVKRMYSSLEDYFIKNYGNRLYRLIFRPLFSTYFKADLKDIDPSFAEAALSVATKQQKVNAINMIWTVLTGKKIRFHYPAGGCGELIGNIEKKIRASRNVTIKSSVDIISINKNSAKVRHAGHEETVQFDRLIWAAPLTALCKLLSVPCPRLKFTNLILYNVEYRSAMKNSYQYAYVAQEGRPFHRFMLLHNISGSLSRNQLVTLEKTTTKNKEGDLSDAERKEIGKELALFRIISSPDEIIAIHKEFVTDVYPLYYKGFMHDVDRAKGRIREKNSNIICMGRSGNYSYLNMDHVLKESLEFDIRNIRTGSKSL